MDDSTKGRFAAIELMLGQLFAMRLEGVDDPQRWLADSVELNRTLLGRRVQDGTMSQEMADAALASVQTAMQTASRHFESQGVGTAIS